MLRVAAGLIRMIAVLSLVSLGGCGATMLNAMTSGSGSRATNVVFDDATGLKLDVYTPDNARNAPVVIFYFGSRWQSGSRDEFEFVGNALASQGIVAVLPSYRFYPQVKYPGFVQDSAKAVAWVHRAIGNYGGDPNRIVVMGYSAGAYNAAMLALDDEFMKGVGGSRDWLRGMIGLAGPYDFLPLTQPDLRDLFGPPEQFDRTQPVVWADGRNPPLLLVHGENDNNIFVSNTRSLAQRVKNSGGPVTTLIYPELSHEMIIECFSSTYRNRADVLNNVVDFVRKVTAGPPPNRSGGVGSDSISTVPLSGPQPVPLPSPKSRSR